MIRVYKTYFTLLVILFTSTVLVSQSDGQVKWYTLEEAVKLSEEAPKKIFIDVMTEWCGWCKKMDREVFSHPDIAAMLNEQYYAVRLDAQQKEDIVFKGETFQHEMYGQKGFNRFAVELLKGRMGFPSLVFLDEEFTLIQSLEGYQKVERLQIVLSYFGENNYKSTPWPAFVRAYQSKAAIDKLNKKSLQRVGGNK